MLPHVKRPLDLPGLPDISHGGISEWLWAPSSIQALTGFTETTPVIETRALQ